jgi:hypothetical protein
MTGVLGQIRWRGNPSQVKVLVKKGGVINLGWESGWSG